LAAILYTSGTTGDPKGVMLSQGNLASNCASCIKLDIVRPDDNMLCILPLHHTYPAMVCMLLPLSMGATITLLNSLKGPDILACMQDTKVSIMVGVPQLFAGLRRAIFEGIQKRPASVRLMVGILLTVNGLLRKTWGANIGRAVFGKVHAMFGPSFRLFASGGARLEPDVYRDMTNLGFMVIEGYGLTETSPLATFNPLSKQKAGSIGIPVPDVEVRIADRGAWVERDARVLPEAAGDRGGPARRVVLHRGPRLSRSGRILLHHRQVQGDDRAPDREKDIPRGT
jgi:long-chain acyl-CoA synthetase